MMQLIYRGQTYSTTVSALDLPDMEIVGKYRGNRIAHKPTIGMNPANDVHLCYRGIRYTRHY